MKLRNKKTGEIGYFCFANWDDPVLIIMDRNGVQLAKYNSLSELNAEWEDVEEPKEYWYIGDSGEVWGFSHYYLGTEIEETHREIGNLFETKEEAEKAVEKLKAWKRLKDKGFRFIGKTYETDKRFGSLFYKVNEDTYSEDIIHELNICFGGEE